MKLGTLHEGTSADGSATSPRLTHPFDIDLVQAVPASIFYDAEYQLTC